MENQLRPEEKENRKRKKMRYHPLPTTKKLSGNKVLYKSFYVYIDFIHIHAGTLMRQIVDVRIYPLAKPL